MSKNNLTKALGPIAPLLDDPEILEIMVDGPGRITFQKQGKQIEDAGARFESNDAVKDAVKAVLNSIGVEMEENKAIYDARLNDNSRMLAVLSPAAVNGHSVIFRKFPARQVSWEQLFEYKSLTPEMRDLIQSALDARVNILMAGGTASGKTTLANRVIELIPPEERIVAVEQTHEFQFEHPRAVFLEADESMNANMNNLLTAGSKMRPDWLVVGELLGAEAMRAMQLFSNGHSGITTIHAESAENALTRLETMCLMANLGLGLDDIRAMIASALRVITYQECLVPNGKRKVTQIVELDGLRDGRYVLQPLARYNAETEQFELTSVRPSWQK